MLPLGPAMDAAISSEHLVKRFTELPLQGLKAWSDNVPFKMDALGLVTLLGADQVSTAIGSLQRRRYTGALPLLAASVLAGDRSTSVQPGFAAYKLSDGTKSTELSGWFTRWLMCQNVNNATTTFEWKRRPPSYDSRQTRMIAMTVSCSLIIPLVVLTGLMGDWYGVPNAGAIVVSVAVRVNILGQQRRARDDAIRTRAQEQGGDLWKFLVVTRSDGKMVTLHIPSALAEATFRQQELLPKHPILYRLAQQAAWVALGTHLLVLGMCTLVTQVYTVILLVSSTIVVRSTADWSADTQAATPTALEHAVIIVFAFQRRLGCYQGHLGKIQAREGLVSPKSGPASACFCTSETRRTRRSNVEALATCTRRERRPMVERLPCSSR
jgi:hypothetical protein